MIIVMKSFFLVFTDSLQYRARSTLLQVLSTHGAAHISETFRNG